MNSKQKGTRGERDLASTLRSHGYACRRTQQYAGATEDASDVVGLPGLHIECKRVERLNIEDAMAQSKRDAKEKIPTVMHRKNNCEWLVTLRLEDFITIYREFEAGHG